MWTSTRERNSNGSAVSVPAVGPSDLSERYVTVVAARSYVSRSRATGFRAQSRARRVAGDVLRLPDGTALRETQNGGPGDLARTLRPDLLRSNGIVCLESHVVNSVLQTCPVPG